MDLITFQKLSNRRKLALVFRFVVLGLAVLLATPFVGQQPATPTGIAVVDDWSHHRLVFSNPGTLVDAVRTGTVEQWYKIISDPRYQMQQRRRSLTQRPVAAVPDFAAQTAILSAPSQNPAAASKKKQPLRKDWSTNLGSGVAASLTGTVGTLNSSSVSSSSTLTVDGVTFDASPPTPASATGTFSTEPDANSTLTITGLGNTLILTASSTTSSSCTFSSNSSTVSFTRSSTTNTNATRLAALINTSGCGSVVGVSAAAPGSSQVVITAATAGSAGNNITLRTTSSSGTNFRISAWTSTTSLAGGTDGTTSGTASPPTFAYWSGATYATSAAVATNIATAINANTTLQTVSTGVSATANSPGSGNVTITARTGGSGGNSYAVTATSFTAFTPSGNLSGGATATVQPNTFPAKFAFGTTTASCSSDFVVYPTGVPGATGAANIIAYNNLYTGGCTGTVPSVYWAYNTGGTVTTSPTISFDGKQVAFIQVSGTTASLVLLKWAASTTESVTAPGTLTVQASASAYRSCTAPCFYSVSLSANDTFSSPYYDYANDAMYVGDDTGKLHRITGVFNGTSIAEASGFPVTLNSSNKVSSPVYEANSGYVFVGDMGGVLYSVTTSGTIHGNTGSLGDVIVDAPLVDGSAGSVNVFVTSSGSSKPFAGNNVVVDFSTAFTAYGTPGTVYVGAGGAGYYLYAGNFDNVYYQSSNHTGNLYVVGNTGAAGGAALYQVVVGGGFFSGTVNTAASGLNATEHPWPSPVTEFCNNGASACALNSGKTATTSGTDYLFFSVNRGTGTGCTNAAGHGCILAYNISNPISVSQSLSGLDVTTPGTNGCWATSGLVIDNSVNALAGASQTYFINLNGNAAGNGTTQTSTGCTAGTTATIAAVQAAQANP